MENLKHTPAPWKITIDLNELYVTAENEKQSICKLPIKYQYSNYNAKLIASAPELLEACQRAKIFMELFSPNKLGDGSQNSRDLEFMINAIKKATE